MYYHVRIDKILHNGRTDIDARVEWDFRSLKRALAMIGREFGADAACWRIHDITDRTLDIMRLENELKVALESTYQFIVMTFKDGVPAIEKYENIHNMYNEIMSYLTDHYEAIQSVLANNITEELIKSGMDEKKAKRIAEKQANEDARFILPNACETKIVVTMNARSLFNFFSHRCCNRAQWEIRELAEKMYKLVYPIAPTLFSHAGPSCVVTGKCPEGSMTCGKIKDMKKKYELFKK